MIVVGIDPGAGTKSPTGLCFLDVANNFNITTYALRPTTKDKFKRYADLADQFDMLLEDKLDDNYIVACEYFYMRAKGGETLQRLIGAYYSECYDADAFIEIQNVRVKQFIGGSGSASKEQVAEGVVNWFEDKNTESKDKVLTLIKDECWDELDAIAIAISGYLEYT